MRARLQPGADETMTIRLLADEPRDGSALQRLVERDSALLPAGPVLGAWVGDELVAAVGLDGGSRAIADPFRESAGAAAILASRARQIQRDGTRSRRPRRSPARPRLA